MIGGKILTTCLILCTTSSVVICRADGAATTQPAPAVKTGAITLTFTTRSPLSTPKELARRLNLKLTDLGPDYDLAKQPFKAYVPTNYDPSQPLGIFVYLGYKDTVSDPPEWRPVLEKAHMIFISPVSHSGRQYLPSIPLWQTTGLALDAVYNLKQQYAIDDRRIYEMAWAEDGMPSAFASPDVFTGFVVAFDERWFESIPAGGNSYYRSSMPAPPIEMQERAKPRPFFLIDQQSGPATEMALKAKAMESDGYAHVMRVTLSPVDDLHFPHLKAEWFSQQALPFLDRYATASGNVAHSENAPAASAPSEAESLLSRARLLIANGQPDLAREKLQEIVNSFPNDPAAAQAKALLAQIAGQ